MTLFLKYEQFQINDDIKRLSQLKQRIEQAIDGGSTEVPKWLEDGEDFQTLLRDVEVGPLIRTQNKKCESSEKLVVTGALTTNFWHRWT